MKCCCRVIFHSNNAKSKKKINFFLLTATVVCYPAVFNGSALFNICRKALGHLRKFTQRSIPYRFGLAG